MKPNPKDEPGLENPSRRRFIGLAGGATLGALLASFGMPSFASPLVDTEKVRVLRHCTGCTGCVTACPTSAIVVRTGKVKIIDAKCDGCGRCIAACPLAAIRYQDDF